MKLKVLGSGSNANCYLLQSNSGETLIIECGVDIKEIKKALNFNFSKVAGAIITHEHLDHAKEVFDLIMLGVGVYASHGTFKALIEKNNRGRVNGKIFTITQMQKNTMQEMKTYKVGSFTVTTFSVKHDALEPLGFLIEHPECGTILFATDTYYIPYSFKDFDVNHVMIECNYSKEILRYNNQLEKLKDRIIHSHLELEDVKEFFRANQFTELRDVVLLHLSNANSNAEQFTEEIRTLTKRPVYVADKGLEVDFDLYKF